MSGHRTTYWHDHRGFALGVQRRVQLGVWLCTQQLRVLLRDLRSEQRAFSWGGVRWGQRDTIIKLIFIKKCLILSEKNYIIPSRHWGCSSAGLERLPVTQKVAGSSPVNPASFFVLSFWPYRLMVRTPPFQGENPGSNPSRAAIRFRLRYSEIALASAM